MENYYKKFYIVIWIWLLLSEKYWNLKIWTIHLVGVDKSVIEVAHPKWWNIFPKIEFKWKVTSSLKNKKLVVEIAEIFTWAVQADGTSYKRE